MTDPIRVALTAFEAYAEDDLEKLVAVLADDFHFSSPLDNRLNRETYLERCWPNHEWIQGFAMESVAAAEGHVFVCYTAEKTDGGRFRNVERLTVGEGKIQEVEVFFGWSLPHPAPDGDFVAGE